MSFSGMVKEELSKKLGASQHCRVAELAAFYSACGKIRHLPDGTRELRLQTENETVARKCFTILKKTFNIETDIAVHENSHLKRCKVYSITIKETERVREILKAVKLSAKAGGEGALGVCHAAVVQKECCRRAFIRGAFLASGSISDPKKGYHFEIVCAEEEKARQLQGMIRSFQIDAKIVLRKKSYVVYVKEGAQIVDMLAVMEANVALMDLENIRILKEMRNSVNRKVNCETANINKTVSAAVKQVEDIKLIESMAGFESLSEGLEEIARLRLQYPEATLKELGMMLNPQVGKSGVNHRLRKLGMIADALRKSKEELL